MVAHLGPTRSLVDGGICADKLPTQHRRFIREAYAVSRGADPKTSASSRRSPRHINSRWSNQTPRAAAPCFRALPPRLVLGSARGGTSAEAPLRTGPRCQDRQELTNWLQAAAPPGPLEEAARRHVGGHI